MKLTKHRSGSLVKRGSRYYVRAMIEGKVITKALRDEEGNPITTKAAAEIAREKFMAPFAVATKAEALQSLAGKLADSQAQVARWKDEQNPALTIAQAWGEFLVSPNRPDSGGETLYQYECQWTRFNDWMKEQHPDVATLREVGREIAEEYAGTLNHGTLSANSYNKHLNLLALVFRTVRAKAKLTENVWESPKRGGFLQRKRLVTHSRRELTVDELRTVCQSATGELRVLLALGVYTGLRLGDCATLRWCEVDLARAIIRRVPNKTARRNPKTVIVPIHPVLRDMLAETPKERRGEFVLAETAAQYQRRIDVVTDLVQVHFKACGIKVWQAGTGPGDTAAAAKHNRKRAVIEVGFHSLRHTFVSLCRDSNAPLAVVESIVGHSNPAMTRHYTHVGELAAGQAVAALPAVVGEAKPEPPKRDTEATLLEARALVEALTPENANEKRAALLALLKPGGQFEAAGKQ
jgi:integrase